MLFINKYRKPKYMFIFLYQIRGHNEHKITATESFKNTEKFRYYILNNLIGAKTEAMLTESELKLLIPRVRSLKGKYQYIRKCSFVCSFACGSVTVKDEHRLKLFANRLVYTNWDLEETSNGKLEICPSLNTKRSQ
jgi:hypothetical protein